MMASGRRDRCELGDVPCVCTDSLLTDAPQTGQNRAPGVTRWPEGQVGGVPPSNGNDMAFPRCFPNVPESKNIRIAKTGTTFSRCPVGSLVRRCSWPRTAAVESVLNRLSSKLVVVGFESGSAGQAQLCAGDSHSRPQECLSQRRPMTHRMCFQQCGGREAGLGVLGSAGWRRWPLGKGPDS